MGRQYTVEHYRERLDAVRAAVPGIAISTDVIVGFCGETEAQFESTLDLLRAIGYDQVFAAAFSSRPGTPAARLPDDVPAADKRRRLNTLLDLQEGIGLERNRAWLGRRMEVLVDAVVPPRSHDHEADDAPAAESGGGTPPEAASALSAASAIGAGAVHLAGRSRENKLVHLTGPAALVGSIVNVRIDHAAPYSLRGGIA
jgi:tRNA-2-methylthio-N6-dimethylallyladenosine synthase